MEDGEGRGKGGRAGAVSHTLTRRTRLASRLPSESPHSLLSPLLFLSCLSSSPSHPHQFPPPLLSFVFLYSPSPLIFCPLISPYTPLPLHLPLSPDDYWANRVVAIAKSDRDPKGDVRLFSKVFNRGSATPRGSAEEAKSLDLSIICSAPPVLSHPPAPASPSGVLEGSESTGHS
ncbi:unnamed protein product [Pleuronectes platessa]|uniref:Uncharacterized protein n=1 Tax=Pleuronectes platessa TaxID=8262 RepID=A0A9N7Z335_PLEPL|nr:unnamed protein product [Pleuronectes platessa]